MWTVHMALSHMDPNIIITWIQIWNLRGHNLQDIYCFFGIYMASAILCALTAHHTPNLRSCKGISQTSQEFLEHQYLLQRLLIFPFNINQAPSRKNTRFLQQEIHWLPTLETTRNTKFLLANPGGERKKGCCISLSLYWYTSEMLLPWELRILKLTFEKPTSKKIFWDLFPFDYQYCPIFLPLNNKVFLSSFC